MFTIAETCYILVVRSKVTVFVIERTKNKLIRDKNVDIVSSFVKTKMDGSSKVRFSRGNTGVLQHFYHHMILKLNQHREHIELPIVRLLYSTRAFFFFLNIASEDSTPFLVEFNFVTMLL
jgi:hypothetical protein